MGGEARRRAGAVGGDPPASGNGSGNRKPAPKRNKKTAAKAAELAGTMIDWLGDKSAPPQEQANRKRRLVKGPSEFREMRSDQAKPGR